MAKDPKLMRSPWARIYLASKRGTGVRLSAVDVQHLVCDDAIMTRGMLDAKGIANEEDAEDDDFPDDRSER